MYNEVKKTSPNDTHYVERKIKHFILLKTPGLSGLMNPGPLPR